MSEEEDEVMVLCGSSGIQGIEGTYDVCGKCGNAVFLSASTLRSAAQNGLTRAGLSLYCLYCALPKLKDNPKPFPLTEEQQNELLMHILKPTDA